jgi:hypothetical protein
MSVITRHAPPAADPGGGTAALERGYRRLLACYPRDFRRESGPEMLGVLLDAARPGQRRPRPGEAADLLRGAVVRWLRPGVPSSARTLRAAVELMYAAAVLELAAAVTIALTVGQVHAAMLLRHPGVTAVQWHAVTFELTAKEIGAPLVALLLVRLARANGRGQDWARLTFTALAGLSWLSLGTALADGAAAFARPDVAIGGAVGLIQLAAVVLIFQRQSARYYRPATAARPQGQTLG